MENCIILRDAMIEILARLPVRSLMRFKCVCKFFYFLIKRDHHFKHKHYEISRVRNDYVIFERDRTIWGNHRGFGLVYKESDCDKIECVDLCLPISLIRGITCVDGMLCLVTIMDDPEGVCSCVWRILIWNPSTRETKELPYIKPPEKSNQYYKAFGFGLSSNMTGKVVMIWDTPDPIAIVCSQEGNSWSWKRFSHSFYILDVDRSGLYLKGKYYWSCTLQEKDKKQRYLLWFDFDDETFSKIELPKIRSWAAISTMKDTITLISRCTDENHIEIWTMNEHNNIIGWHKYASLDSNIYSHPMRIWNMGGHLLVYSMMLELPGTEDDDGVRYVKHFVSHDLVTQEKKIIYNIDWDFSEHPPLVYSESLKLL